VLLLEEDTVILLGYCASKSLLLLSYCWVESRVYDLMPDVSTSGFNIQHKLCMHAVSGMSIMHLLHTSISRQDVTRVLTSCCKCSLKTLWISCKLLIVILLETVVRVSEIGCSQRHVKHMLCTSTHRLLTSWKSTCPPLMTATATLIVSCPLPAWL